MAKKSLYSVCVVYKPHKYYDNVRIDKFYAYAFNECHALNCVLRKLFEEYDIDTFELVDKNVFRVYNFVL